MKLFKNVELNAYNLSMFEHNWGLGLSVSGWRVKPRATWQVSLHIHVLKWQWSIELHKQGPTPLPPPVIL